MGMGRSGHVWLFAYVHLSKCMLACTKLQITFWALGGSECKIKEILSGIPGGLNWDDMNVKSMK